MKRVGNGYLGFPAKGMLLLAAAGLVPFWLWIWIGLTPQDFEEALGPALVVVAVITLIPFGLLLALLVWGVAGTIGVRSAYRLGLIGVVVALACTFVQLGFLRIGGPPSPGAAVLVLGSAAGLGALAGVATHRRWARGPRARRRPTLA